ncbi:MAG: hypothetical protein EPN14_06250 [Gallionella sp.]|nr:MAG: hypothetical protein EPN14_06250 [Gallionella sp.]
MQFQFNNHKILFAAALLLGNTASAAGENAVDGATQAQPPKHDFSVVTETKDKTHPHYAEGVESGFTVNGVQGRTLTLVRGKTYTFEVDTGVTHDFYFSTKPIGWGMDTLTAGIKGQYTYKGIVTFKPAAETPDTVYYSCRNHKYMGGDIRIVNPGEEGKL